VLFYECQAAVAVSVENGKPFKDGPQCYFPLLPALPSPEKKNVFSWHGLYFIGHSFDDTDIVYKNKRYEQYFNPAPVKRDLLINSAINFIAKHRNAILKLHFN